MVNLNSKLEVADFVNESQFEPAESAFMCVAFCASLCRYAGQPGKGATGTGEQVDTTADYWYAKLEGSSAASNTNGMSLQAEYSMLSGLGMHYHALPITGDNTHNLEYIKAWLKLGYPVLLCGAETGMFDMELGHVPYSWTPTGNHAIVASGIAPDGNLLVRDTASIATTGVRPGPRRYDANKLRLVSATAISMPWLAVLPANYDPLKAEEPMIIDLSMPAIAAYFKADGATWLCTKTNKHLALGMLKYYRENGTIPYCGFSSVGLPLSDEMKIEEWLAQLGPSYQQTYQHLTGKGIVVQVCERGILIYDPAHLYSNPPGSGPIYPLTLYDGGLGTDPRVAQSQAQIATLQESSNTALLAEYDKAKAKIDQAAAILTAS